MSDLSKKTVLVCTSREQETHTYALELNSFICELGNAAVTVNADAKDMLKKLDRAIRKSPSIIYTVVVGVESSKDLHYLW